MNIFYGHCVWKNSVKTKWNLKKRWWKWNYYTKFFDLFQVKEYCPLVFRNLRERFGIFDSAYMKSLTRPPKRIDSPGKSGAKFYLSYDQLYIIKTLTSEEIEQMHSLLKQYHPFVVERHGMYSHCISQYNCWLKLKRIQSFTSLKADLCQCFCI